MSGGRGRCVLTLCAGPLFVRGPSASLIEPFCGDPFGNARRVFFLPKRTGEPPAGERRGVRTLAGTPLAWLALRSSGRLLCPIRGFGRAHRLPAATSPAFAIGLLAGSWLGPCTFPPARVRLTA